MGTDQVNKPDHYVKYCGKCEKERPIKDFAKNTAKKDGLQERCRECRATHYSKTGYAKKAYKNRLIRKYNVTVEFIENLEVQQKGLCAICSGKNKSLVIDHCHSTGKVRGLLCTTCNTSLGLLKEKEENFLSAISYLKKHGTNE